MSKKTLFFCLLILLFAGYGCFVCRALAVEVKEIEPLEAKDRVMIFAPHPDDETIACAGIIQEAVRVGADLHIVYLTNGDHNQVAFIVYEKRLTLRRGEFIHMGEVRKKEAIKAAEVLGVSRENLMFLGYPDFGTFAILSYNWQGSRPYRSLLTRISSVPYKDNLSFRAPYKGESILYDIEKVLLEYKPNKIFVSHPADANVDHKALYLFLQIALQDLKGRIGQPKVYPYLVHCLGWPLPRHYHSDLALEPPKQFQDTQINWSKFTLSKQQLENKHKAILCHKSQTESSAFYLLSFARRNELFGDYPDINLGEWQFLLDQGAMPSSEIYEEESGQEKEYADESPDILENKGRVSYSLDNDFLVIRINKNKELNSRFGGLVYIFGYSDKVSFAQMPKIRIITKHNKFRIFDGRKIIQPQEASLKLKGKELVLRVPLEILGNPDFILTAVKNYSGILHTDASSFRRIDLR